MANFTVFGLQKTSTRFLERTIRQNIEDVTIRNMFHDGWVWKHAFKIAEGHDNLNPASVEINYTKGHYALLDLINCIHVHRNPYTWIESVILHPIDVRKTYPKVNNKEYDSDLMFSGFNIKRLVALWNDHARYWVEESKKRPVYRIRQEDMFESTWNTRLFIEGIAKLFDVKLKSKPEEIIVSQIDEGKRQKYLNVNVPLLQGSPEVMAFLKNSLDSKIMAMFRYEYL